MKAPTVKGLLCHRASEAVSPIGPDYEYGWSVVNGNEVVALISNNGSKI